MRSYRDPRSTRWWAKRKSTSSGAREQLIVETDGAATHLTAEAFEDDRRRDLVHSMMGFRTLRFTWRQVVYEPGFVAKAIATALAG
jgi:very-short-patch-repair endonuclease